MKEKQKKGIISVFQQIAEQCKERETVEKTCIHVVSPKEVQNMCKDAGLSDAVFYGVLSVSSAIANGMRKNGCDELETKFKGELLVMVENLKLK